MIANKKVNKLCMSIYAIIYWNKLIWPYPFNVDVRALGALGYFLSALDTLNLVTEMDLQLIKIENKQSWRD